MHIEIFIIDKKVLFSKLFNLVSESSNCSMYAHDSFQSVCKQKSTNIQDYSFYVS